MTTYPAKGPRALGCPENGLVEKIHDTFADVAQEPHGIPQKLHGPQHFVHLPHTLSHKMTDNILSERGVGRK